MVLSGSAPGLSLRLETSEESLSVGLRPSLVSRRGIVHGIDPLRDNIRSSHRESVGGAKERFLNSHLGPRHQDRLIGSKQTKWHSGCSFVDGGKLWYLFS